MDFFHPAINKLCEAMGVASQGAIARSTTERKKSCNRVICFMLKLSGAIARVNSLHPAPDKSRRRARQELFDLLHEP
jgi:hypothetical protein